MSFTSALKVRQLAVVVTPTRTPPTTRRSIIYLEPGGAPRDETGLRPEAWPAAHIKEVEEDRVHLAVCGGTMTVYAAGDAGPARRCHREDDHRIVGEPGSAPDGRDVPRQLRRRPCGAKAPLHRGGPGYRPTLDGDGDGIACE